MMHHDTHLVEIVGLNLKSVDESVCVCVCVLTSVWRLPMREKV